jgi:hypothetical protein
MAVRTRITPINRNIELIMQRSLSPQAQSVRLASYARARLAEAQEINRQALGRVPPHETFVDRRQGAPLESVKPDGLIVFDFELLDDLFAWIGEQLVIHAPVLTGEYQRSFVFFADGVEVDPGAQVPPAQEYVFLNTQPYARKIERGLSDQAPDGVFQAVATLAKERFGNMASIRFSYRALNEGGIMAYQPAGSAAARDRRGRFTAAGADRSAQKLENSLRTPAIVITLR